LEDKTQMRTQHCFVRRLVRGSMSGVTERCYEIGLRIYHTKWRRCTLAYASELCIPLSFLFLLVHL